MYARVRFWLDAGVFSLLHELIVFGEENAMAFFRALQSLFRKQPSPVLSSEGERPAYRDTLSVISDLSRLVRNDPEAVDVYLALGNLFRAQGDIERAVLIRESLIARQNLNIRFTARAYFELGQDYHRAGVVDRALSSFREAARLGYSRDAVTAELAELFASAGDFEQAAEEYGKMKHSLAQAHYLVLRSREFSDAGNASLAEKFLQRALKIYPGSIEAWSAHLRMGILEKSTRRTCAHLERAFVRVAPTLRFLLLDAILDSLTALGAEKPEKEPDPFVRELVMAIIAILEKQEPHILVHYYGALLLRHAGDVDSVDIWLAKALVVQPHFWAARLQSLALSVQKHELPPVVGLQVHYLAEELKYIRRFTCTVCGFRENRIFYRCRRCGSWHSLAFRISLQQ
jgi:Predicted N-acetylglucosaminyl transferase